MNYWKKPCKCSKIAYQLMVNYADIIMFDDNFRKGWGGESFSLFCYISSFRCYCGIIIKDLNNIFSRFIIPIKISYCFLLLFLFSLLCPFLKSEDKNVCFFSLSTCFILPPIILLTRYFALSYIIRKTKITHFTISISVQSIIKINLIVHFIYFYNSLAINIIKHIFYSGNNLLFLPCSLSATNCFFFALK